MVSHTIVEIQIRLLIELQAYRKSNSFNILSTKAILNFLYEIFGDCVVVIDFVVIKNRQSLDTCLSMMDITPGGQPTPSEKAKFTNSGL